MSTQQSSLEALELRVASLERQSRRWKILTTVLISALAAVLLTAQSRPRARTVEAEKFVLKDDRGKRRAELLMDESGPALVLYSPAGNRVGRFGGTEQGMSAGLSLQAANGVSQATLISMIDGPHLLLFDSEGRFRSELGAAKNGPYLYFHNPRGERRVALVVESDLPRLQMQDEEGFTAVLGSSSVVRAGSGAVEKTHASSLVLYGKDKEMLWSAP